MQRTENVELTVLCLIHENDNYLLQNRLKEDWKGLAFPSLLIVFWQYLVKYR